MPYPLDSYKKALETVIWDDNVPFLQEDLERWLLTSRVQTLRDSTKSQYLAVGQMCVRQGFRNIEEVAAYHFQRQNRPSTVSFWATALRQLLPEKEITPEAETSYSVPVTFWHRHVAHALSTELVSSSVSSYMTALEAWLPVHQQDLWKPGMAHERMQKLCKTHQQRAPRLWRTIGQVFTRLGFPELPPLAGADFHPEIEKALAVLVFIGGLPPTLLGQIHWDNVDTSESGTLVVDGWRLYGPAYVAAMTIWTWSSMQPPSGTLLQPGKHKVEFDTLLDILRRWETQLDELYAWAERARMPRFSTPDTRKALDSEDVDLSLDFLSDLEEDA